MDRLAACRVGTCCWAVGDQRALALSHPQEAAERESKLFRDLSAANEKNLLLQNQVWGCGARPPWGLGGKASLRGVCSPGGRTGAEGEVSAGAAVPGQAGADRHVGRAEDAGCAGRGWAHAGLLLRGLEAGAPGTGGMPSPGNEGTPKGVPPTLSPWASRAPGAGEKEVPAEPGGLGAPAPQGGASSVASFVSCSPHCPPPGLQWCPQSTPLAGLPSTTLRGWVAVLCLSWLTSDPEPSDQVLEGPLTMLGPHHNADCCVFRATWGT